MNSIPSNNNTNRKRPNMLKKHNQKPINTLKTETNASESQKIVVSADDFNNFEYLKLKTRRKLSNSSESSCHSHNNLNINEADNIKSSILSESSKTSDDYSSDSSVKDEIEENSENSPKKAVKLFEEVIIKSEFIEINDNTIKIPDKADKNIKKEGELHNVEGGHEVSHSHVSDKCTSSPPAGNNRIFIIKNHAGKSVTLVSKSAPVVLNKEKTLEHKKPVAVYKSGGAVNKTVVLNKNLLKESCLKPNPAGINRPINIALEVPNTGAQPQCKKIFQRLPNGHIVKISDINKSQKYFNPIHTQNFVSEVVKQSVSPKKIIEIDLTEPPEVMKKNVMPKTMPNFSKILQVLTESSSETSSPKTVSIAEKKIPIYVESETQTEHLIISRDQSVQTEVYMPSPTPSLEDLPNITNLLEYVFSTPKYSSGLDEIKKNDLIDMSKSIAMKGKLMSQFPKGEDGLKKQLFLDLKDCATFDFLGNKPIHNAVIENNIVLLKRQIFCLRLRKITLDIANNQGQTALQLAVAHNCNIEIITFLLGNGASVYVLDNEGNNLIHLAVMNSTHFVLELLMKYFNDVVKEINRKNDEGLTPLMLAAIDSKPEMVDSLLRNKADPNLRDEKSGRTALFHAVELNCNYVINLLLKYKADPKVRNFFGLTALDAAKDLDLPDSKILEAEKETNNQTSVIVANGGDQVASGNKRNGQNQNGDSAKKSKLSFVQSYQKIHINEVKKSTPTTKKRKKN